MSNQVRNVKILGEHYSIKVSNELEDSRLALSSGYCDDSVKRIVVDELQETDVMDVDDMESVRMRILRHEIVHAYLNESGLGSECSWASEEMVDWVARQFPKLLRTFIDLEII